MTLRLVVAGDDDERRRSRPRDSCSAPRREKSVPSWATLPWARFRLPGEHFRIHGRIEQSGDVRRDRRQLVRSISQPEVPTHCCFPDAVRLAA